MSGLFGNLASGVKALNAQSRALETAGRNIANVNNAGYARQRVVLGDRGTVLTTQGAQSLGVEARQVQQLRDLLLDRQVSREIALTSSLSSRQFAHQKAEAALGQSIDRSANAASTASSTGGVAGSLADFFSAFDSFATSPTDAGVRQTRTASTRRNARAGVISATRNPTRSVVRTACIKRASSRIAQ